MAGEDSSQSTEEASLLAPESEGFRCQGQREWQAGSNEVGQVGTGLVTEAT